MSRQRLTNSSGFVRALLGHFDRVGWPGAPRPEGVTVEGCPIVSEPEGHVARFPAQPPAVWSAASLARVARLVRQFHDLTAGTALAGDGEVVCHNDLAPANTVYRLDDGRLVPYAFIGWEHAAPGCRVDDIAHVCWTFLALGPRPSGPTAFGRLMRAVCDAYGLDGGRRATVVDTMLTRLGWYADDGDEVRQTVAWVESGRTELDTAMG